MSTPKITTGRKLRYTDLGVPSDVNQALRAKYLELLDLALPVVIIKPSDGTLPDPAADNPNVGLNAGANLVGTVKLANSSGTIIDPSTLVDPVSNVGQNIFQRNYSISAKTNPVPIGADVNIGSTLTVMTFESPVGTDYQVPAGKTLEIYGLLYSSNTANVRSGIAYGDTGVAAGTTDPTAVVQIVDIAMFVDETANKNFTFLGFFGSVPAAKYPALRVDTATGTKVARMMGTEYT